MRSVALITALIGAASANPVLHWPRNYFWPTGHSSSSVPLPTSGTVVPPPPSGGSTSKPSYPTSYSISTPWSAPSSVATGSSKPSSSIPWSSTGGVSTGTGYPSSTETITTYTTTTVCPVTETTGTQVITTLTTSIITITSCKGGCHQSTPPSSPPSTPTGPSSIVVPTVLTTSSYVFIPVSSSVGHNGHTTVYSTYLTSEVVSKTYSTWATIYPSTVTPPTVTPPVVTPPSGSCPAPATVTVTVTAPPPPPTNCPDCTKTYTITESGTTTCITVTNYPTTTTYVSSIETPPSSVPGGPGGPSSTSTYQPSGPIGTGTGYPTHPHPSGTGVPYPSWDSSSTRRGPKPTNSMYYGGW